MKFHPSVIILTTLLAGPAHADPEPVRGSRCPPEIPGVIAALPAPGGWAAAAQSQLTGSLRPAAASIVLADEYPALLRLAGNPHVGDRFRSPTRSMFDGVQEGTRFEVVGVDRERVRLARVRDGVRLPATEFSITRAEFQRAIEEASRRGIDDYHNRIGQPFEMDTAFTRERAARRESGWRDLVTRIRAHRAEITALRPPSVGATRVLFRDLIAAIEQFGYQITRSEDESEAFINLEGDTRSAPRELDTFLRSVRAEHGSRVRLSPRMLDPTIEYGALFDPRIRPDGSRYPVITLDIGTLTAGAPTPVVVHEVTHSRFSAAGSVRQTMQQIFALVRSGRAHEIPRIDPASLPYITRVQQFMVEAPPLAVRISGSTHRPEVQIRTNGALRWVALEEYAAARLGLRDYHSGGAISETGPQFWYRRPPGHDLPAGIPRELYGREHLSDEFEANFEQILASVNQIEERIRHDGLRGDAATSELRSAMAWMNFVVGFRALEMTSLRELLARTSTVRTDGNGYVFRTPAGEEVTVFYRDLSIDLPPPPHPAGETAARELLTRRRTMLDGSARDIRDLRRRISELNAEANSAPDPEVHPIAGGRRRDTIAAPRRETGVRAHGAVHVGEAPRDTIPAPPSRVDGNAATDPPPPSTHTGETEDTTPRDTIPAPPPLPGTAGRPPRGLFTDE